MDRIHAYEFIIRDNIGYDDYMACCTLQDREVLGEIYQLICDVVCIERPQVRIAGTDYPYKLVKSQFLKLRRVHVEYVMDCLKNTSTRIDNIKAYLITALFNAPMTINNFYAQDVRHDMYGG